MKMTSSAAAALAALLMTSCAHVPDAPADIPANDERSPYRDTDIDLTVMSGTMVYAQVSDISDRCTDNKNEGHSGVPFLFLRGNADIISRKIYSLSRP